MSAAAEASVQLQHPEACCVLLGKLALDHRTLTEVCYTGFQEGVGGDLGLHAVPLVATVAVAMVCACLWGRR